MNIFDKYFDKQKFKCAYSDENKTLYTWFVFTIIHKVINAWIIYN